MSLTALAKGTGSNFEKTKWKIVICYMWIIMTGIPWWWSKKKSCLGGPTLKKYIFYILLSKNALLSPLLPLPFLYGISKGFLFYGPSLAHLLPLFVTLISSYVTALWHIFPLIKSLLKNIGLLFSHYSSAHNKYQSDINFTVFKTDKVTLNNFVME